MRSTAGKVHMVKKVVLSSAARQAADVMADEILAYEGDDAEWLLGSEDQLMEQLGVGRPTLRQAARLLEHQQLLVVRRGVQGGIFGRKPSAEGVTGNAKVFLRSRATTFADLTRAELVLASECARLAAENPDDEARQNLLHHYDGAGTPPSLRDFMVLSPDFQRSVARVSQSPVLILFVTVLMDLASQSAGIAGVYQDDAKRSETIDRHLYIADAIAARRGAVAADRMAKHLQWVMAQADEHVLSETLEPHRR